MDPTCPLHFGQKVERKEKVLKNGRKEKAIDQIRCKKIPVIKQMAKLCKIYVVKSTKSSTIPAAAAGVEPFSSTSTFKSDPYVRSFSR